MNRFRPAMLCAAAAALLLAGPVHADLFGFLKKKPAPVQPVIDPLDAKKLGYSVSWGADLALPAGVEITAIEQLSDLIVVLDTDRMVTALSKSDGTIRWQTPLGHDSSVYFAPTIWTDKIVVNSQSQVLLLNASDGRIVERQKLASAVSGPPTIIERIAVFGALDGRVFGHDLQAGFLKWAYQMGAPVRARPTAAGTDVFASTVRGVYGLFNKEGTLVWNGRAHDRIVAPAVVERNSLIFPSADHSLYSVSKITGRDQWVYRTTEPLTSPITLVERVVVLHLKKPEIVGVDTTSGEELWRLGGQAQSLSLPGPRLMLNFGNELQTVEPYTGRPIARVNVKPLATVLADDEGGVILLTPRGRLVRLAPGA